MDIPLPQVIPGYIHDSTLDYVRYVPSYELSDLELGVDLCEQDGLREWSAVPVVITAIGVSRAEFQLAGLEDWTIMSWEEAIPASLEEDAMRSLGVAARSGRPQRSVLRRCTIVLTSGSTIRFVCQELLVRRA